MCTFSIVRPKARDLKIVLSVLSGCVLLPRNSTSPLSQPCRVSRACLPRNYEKNAEGEKFDIGCGTIGEDLGAATIERFIIIHCVEGVRLIARCRISKGAGHCWHSHPSICWYNYVKTLQICQDRCSLSSHHAVPVMMLSVPENADAVKKFLSCCDEAVPFVHSSKEICSLEDSLNVLYSIDMKSV